MKSVFVIMFLSFSLHAMENFEKNPMQEVFNKLLNQYLDSEIEKNPEKYKVAPVATSLLKNEIAEIVCNFIKCPPHVEYKKKESALEWMKLFAFDPKNPESKVAYESEDKSMFINFSLFPLPTQQGILDLKNLPPIIEYRIVTTIKTKNSIKTLEKNSDNQFIGAQLLAQPYIRNKKNLKKVNSVLV